MTSVGWGVAIVKVSMIGEGVGVENSSTGGDFFVFFFNFFDFFDFNFLVATSFVSSGIQKKVSSGSVFESGEVDDVVTFIGEAMSYVSSVSGFQKKERSVMGFVCGITGDETIFVGDENHSDFTC